MGLDSLRAAPLSILLLAACGTVLLVACGTTPGPSDPTTSRGPNAGLAAAAEALRSGDFVAAQSEYARATSVAPRSAEAWRGFAESTWGLFHASLRDPGLGNSLLHLQDADRGYGRAIELAPADRDVLIGASRVARERGDAARAAQYAQRARDLVEIDTAPEERFTILQELARSRAAEYEAAVREGAPVETRGELVRRTEEAYRSTRAVLPERTEPVTELASFHARRGALDEAVQGLLAAIARAPEAAPLHQTLCDLCYGSGNARTLEEIYDARLASLAEASATTTWFTAYVKLRAADALRADGDHETAMRAYEVARRHFARSAEDNATFAATARHFGAQSRAGRARCLLESGEAEEAARLLAEAIESDPSILDAPDSLGVTPKSTSLAIGSHFFRSEALEAGATAFERWLRSRPDDVDWLNNAGLFRRDLGESLQRAGEETRAQEAFEASFAHYRRVMALRPDEPRLVNDTGLLLLYHLRRDLDDAERMFRRALELGTAKLEELGDREEPDDADPASVRAAADWDYFAEATGDALQNLGLLLWDRRGESAEIRAHLLRSLELDPRNTRAWLREMLRSLPASGPAPAIEQPWR